MPTNFSLVDNVQDLFNKEFSDTPQTSTSPQQNNSPEQALFNLPTNSTSEKSEDVEKKEDVNVQAEFDKANEEKIKEEENSKLFIKDVKAFSEILKEKGILEAYEDDSLPEKEDEFIDALSQSVERRANLRIEQAWKEKVENLPDALLRIHEYASLGITNATELNTFINSVAQSEAIGSLDVKNPSDQEQIVLIQLLNTGIDEKSAREEIEDLKERNKLEARAGQYYPSLKKTYDDNIRQAEVDKANSQEELQRYLQTNATNVAYFLEKDVEYLPFKFAANDKNYKAQIAQLASQPVDVTPEGSPIFAWQKQIEALQYGDEKAYKDYMDTMAFLANKEKYKEAIRKQASNTTNTANFKKIKDTSGKSVNTTSAEQEEIVTKQKPQNRAWSLG